MRRQLGFTLIELLIVVTVIGTITAIAIPSLIDVKAAVDKASATQAEAVPERMRLDYTVGRLRVWCDTATGTRLYVIHGTGGGIAAVVAGCR